VVAVSLEKKLARGFPQDFIQGIPT